MQRTLLFISALTFLLCSYGRHAPARPSLRCRQKLQESLAEAVRWNDAAKVKQLVIQGAAVNARTPEGSAPLLEALVWGSAECAAMLLGCGADVEVRDAYMRTPLIWAAFKGYTTVGQILLKKKASINAKDAMGRTALMVAAQYGHVDMARLLLKQGADIHVHSVDSSALSIASANGNIAIVQMLLAHGANVDSQNDWGGTPLMEAVGQDRAEVVQCLLDHQAKVNLRDKHGVSALMTAASRGNLGIIQILLSHGASVNAITRNGITALMVASGSPYAVSLSPEGKRLWKMLRIPIFPEEEIYMKITELLLARGAVVDSCNIKQRTALMGATRQGHRNMVSLLLKHRANATLKDNQGKTALDYAIEAGYEDIVALLRRTGGV